MLYHFQKLEKQLTKEGIHRGIAEGPVTFLQRLQTIYPEDQDFYKKFQQMYEEEVYQEQKKETGKRRGKRYAVPFWIAARKVVVGRS